MDYKPCEIEESVSSLYTRLEIYNPNEIQEKQISAKLGIVLTYTARRSFSHEDEKLKLINIDSRLPVSIQREHFYHELCHIMRHAGSQLIMPRLYVDLQENDSKRFTMYAALPYHMIKDYDLTDPYITFKLAMDFKIREELCKDRLRNIKRKIFAESLRVAESKLLYNY